MSSAIFQVTPDPKFVVRHRADARRLADQLIALLGRYQAAADAGSMETLSWWFELRRLIEGNFSSAPGQEGVRTLFDLGDGGARSARERAMVHLPPRPDQSSRGDASKAFIEVATVSTRYTDHERIARIRGAYNEATRAALRHAYFPVLRRDPGSSTTLAIGSP